MVNASATSSPPVPSWKSSGLSTANGWWKSRWTVSLTITSDGGRARRILAVEKRLAGWLDHGPDVDLLAFYCRSVPLPCGILPWSKAGLPSTPCWRLSPSSKMITGRRPRACRRWPSSSWTMMLHPHRTWTQLLIPSRSASSPSSREFLMPSRRLRNMTGKAFEGGLLVRKWFVPRSHRPPVGPAAQAALNQWSCRCL